MTAALIFTSGCCLGMALIELATGHYGWGAFLAALMLWNALSALMQANA